MTEMILDAEKILNLMYQHRDKLYQLGARKIGLFGSYVRGEQTPESDIDILVTLEKTSWSVYREIWDYLESLLHHEVDLVIEDGLKPRVRPYVMKEIKFLEPQIKQILEKEDNESAD